jgi:hypothetical protein
MTHCLAAIIKPQQLIGGYVEMKAGMKKLGVALMLGLGLVTVSSAQQPEVGAWIQDYSFDSPADTEVGISLDHMCTLIVQKANDKLSGAWSYIYDNEYKLSATKPARSSFLSCFVHTSNTGRATNVGKTITCKKLVSGTNPGWIIPGISTGCYAKPNE